MRAAALFLLLLGLMLVPATASALSVQEIGASSNSGVEDTPTAAAVLPTGVAASVPETIVVGHGPDRPNTYHQFEELAAPVVVPYFMYVPILQSRCPPAPPRVGSAGLRAGRFMNDPTERFVDDPTRRFINSGFFTGSRAAADPPLAPCGRSPAASAGGR